MNAGRTVFSQLIAHAPGKELRKCVARYLGDASPKGFSCWDPYLAMAFSQLTYRESLRDIEACLRSMSDQLYRMGFRGRVVRTTLADANEHHDWRICSDFARCGWASPGRSTPTIPSASMLWSGSVSAGAAPASSPALPWSSRPAHVIRSLRHL